MFSIVSSSSHCGPKLQQASRALGDWLRPSPPTNWNSSDCYGEDKKQIQIVLQKPAKKQKIGDLPRLERGALGQADPALPHMGGDDNRFLYSHLYRL